MSQPEIALLLSTYQRPRHLTKALESIALQQGVAGRMELVVTDDGSTDETPAIVADFAREVDFPVHFTTHPHTTFQLARCRNEGVRASRAPYVLFLDGDCILPSDHVRTHLERRKPGVVMAGDCYRLEQFASEQVTSEYIRSGEFCGWAPESEIRRLRKLDRSSRFYQFIRHPTKPKLIGNNVGIWRADYERVNGYDENFRGWGCEDDDLRYRLRAAGVRIESILRWTRTYHLWHPTDVTAPDSWKKGANVSYLLRKGRLTRCRNGLHKRGLDDLAIRVVGRTDAAHPTAQFLMKRFVQPASARPEVEIVMQPGEGKFSGRAECNVLVALEPAAATSALAKQADLTISAGSSGTMVDELPAALERLEHHLGLVA